jgi:aspartyl-tRNA(Asn)/glutamyl-tRNA(Gln) amidotransferase subunit C
MVIDENLIRHVAQLARISLEGVDVARLTNQMSDILNYVELLKEPDVTGIPATAHARPQPLPLREDVPVPGLTTEEAIGNAPRRQGNFVVVPRTVEGGGDT